MDKNITVLMKGAGEMATGVAYRLFQSHFRVVMTDIAQPLAVRRAVSFCEAVHEGKKTVEGVEAILIDDPEAIPAVWDENRIPVLIDPECSVLAKLKPSVYIEATVSKHNTGISKEDASLVIALGPGYQAGRDAHVVIETNRGHDLGRLIFDGQPEQNTGVPGQMAGATWERVLRSPADGVFETGLSLGDRVEQGQSVAQVAGQPVVAQVGGILRGLIRPSTKVSKGLKVGDVDPRGKIEYLHTISEKARAIGGSVLEAILRKYNV